jgi:hypothetical protein
MTVVKYVLLQNFTSSAIKRYGRVLSKPSSVYFVNSSNRTTPAAMVEQRSTQTRRGDE